MRTSPWGRYGRNLKIFSFLNPSFQLVIWMTVELKKSHVRESSWTKIKGIVLKPKSYWFLWAFIRTFLWFPFMLTSIRHLVPGPKDGVYGMCCAGLSPLCSACSFSWAGLWGPEQETIRYLGAAYQCGGRWDRGGSPGAVAFRAPLPHLFSSQWKGNLVEQINKTKM